MTQNYKVKNQTLYATIDGSIKPIATQKDHPILKYIEEKEYVLQDDPLNLLRPKSKKPILGEPYSPEEKFVGIYSSGYGEHQKLLFVSALISIAALNIIAMFAMYSDLYAIILSVVQVVILLVTIFFPFIKIGDSRFSILNYEEAVLESCQNKYNITKEDLPMLTTYEVTVDIFVKSINYGPFKLNRESLKRGEIALNEKSGKIEIEVIQRPKT